MRRFVVPFSRIHCSSADRTCSLTRVVFAKLRRLERPSDCIVRLAAAKTFWRASQQLPEPRHAGELPAIVVPEIHAALPRERAGKVASLLIRLREELRAAFVDAHAIHRWCRGVIALAYDDVAGSRNGGGHSASLLPNRPLVCSIRHRRESQSADQISDRKRVLCKALVDSVAET